MCIIIIFCCFHCFIKKRISKLIRTKIHWYLYQLARPCYGEIFVFEKSRCPLFWLSISTHFFIQIDLNLWIILMLWIILWIILWKQEELIRLLAIMMFFCSFKYFPFFLALNLESQAQKCNNLNPFFSTEPRCRDDATCKSSGDAHRVCLRGQCVCKKHYHQGQDAKCVPGELFFLPNPFFSSQIFMRIIVFECLGQFCVHFLVSLF